MTESATLLRAYVASGSEEAFAELVKAHVDLVYSAALRVAAGDTQLAKDVVQHVFTDLARKAPSLPADVVLAGWLYRHSCFLAAKAIRTERRRQAREREAVAMGLLNDDTDSTWRQLAPVLDEAMNRLSPRERDALILRFFQQKPLRAVGEALGISEEAARKRVERAVASLRNRLVRHGVTLSAATLVAILGTKTVSAAPLGLAATVVSASAAGAAAGSSSLGLLASLTELLGMTKLQGTLAGLLFLAGVATPVVRSAVLSSRPLPSQTAMNRPVSGTVRSPSAKSPSAETSADTPFARLERWVRELDEKHQPYEPWSIDERELEFLVWSLPANDYSRAWALREGLRYEEIQNRLAHVVLQYWAELNPHAALAAAESLRGGRAASSYTPEVLTIWARKEPATALAWIQQSSPDRFRTATLAQIIPWAVTTDPATALGALEQLPAGSLRVRTLASALQRWAATDPAAAAQYLTNLSSLTKHSEVAKWLAKSWASREPEAALAWAESLTRPSERKDALLFALWGSAEQNPASTAALVEKYTQSDPGFNYPWIRDLAKRWAAEDPAAAANWAKALTNSFQRNEAIESVIEEWNPQDLTGAAQYALALPDESTRGAALQTALLQLCQKEPKAAQDWATALPAGPTQDAALKGISEGLARQDPAQAASFVSSLPPGKLQSDLAVAVAYDWATTKPKAAADWVSAFPEGNTRDQAAERVIDGWIHFAREVESASAWLGQLPAGSTRDAAARRFVQDAGHDRPDLAAPWMSSFTNEAQRNWQIEQLATIWLKTDPTAARSWLQATSLPQDRKEKLLGKQAQP